MEFLDSLDFQTNKKINRVRSWYLYEQFKSLESNQLEAARKLKSRYYQEKVLRRELNERKARRALYDQCDHSRTESRITTSVRSVETKTSLVASNEDFLESCYALEDEQIIHDEYSIHDELNAHDEHSEQELAEQEDNDDDSHIDASSDFKSLADLDDSIASVVENLKDSKNITDEIKEELEFVKHGIAENISLQLEAAKENIQCLEEFSEFCEAGEHFESKERIHSNFDKETKVIVPKQEKKSCIYDNNLVAVWMKLVSFAYQIIKLNHGGNCYSDYSSQFLTAVLACDVIRRGFSRMSDILQPYVCPIMFIDDETQPQKSCYKNTIGKKIGNTKKWCNTSDIQLCSPRSIEQNRKKPACKHQCLNKKYKSENVLNPKCQPACKYQCFNKINKSENISNSKCQSQCCKTNNSENCSNVMCKSPCYSRKINSSKYSKYSAENRNNKKRTASDPLPTVSKKSNNPEHSKTHSTLWPSDFLSKESPTHYHCPCPSVRNPMLKVAKYIDDILVHMDHS